MSFKRTVARVKVKVRRRKIEKERNELKKLALERNKALKEAEGATKLAKAREEARGAQLRSMKAQGITPKKKSTQTRGQQMRDINKGILKNMKGVQKFMKKHSR